MKKISVIILLGLILFTGCNKQEKENKDYSEYKFTDISWQRNGDGDTETLKLTSDGKFHYSCGCGNPVNDADLCETYTYNEKNKTIKLECIETTDETITTIKVINVSEDTLELNFNGEIRKFSKELKE